MTELEKPKLNKTLWALIQREPFDYTQWRQTIDGDDSIEDISRKAMALRREQVDGSN